MFKDILSALTLEILRSLQKEKEFKGPKLFKDYLDNVSEENLMIDLRLVFQVINGADLSAINFKKSEFFLTVLRFFTEQFPSKLDALGSGFYLLSYEMRKEKAAGLIEGDSHIDAALRDMMVNNSYQEIAEAIEQMSKAVANGGTIVVQTPCDIGLELKKEMRTKFAEEHAHSAPVFQINRQLIGGFRVFINGQSHDLSWFAQVQKLTSLTARAAGARGHI